MAFDLNAIAGDVTAALHTLEEAGRTVQNSGTLTRAQARELAAIRRDLRDLHTKVWGFADKITESDGDVTTMGGST